MKTKYCDDPDNCTYADCPTAFCDRSQPCSKCGAPFEPHWLNGLNKWSSVCPACAIHSLASLMEDAGPNATVREISEGEQIGAWLRGNLTLLIAASLLFAASAQGQSLVSLCPTQHSVTFKTEANTGTWFPSWQDSTLTTIVLSNRVLTFTHTMHSKGVPVWGTAWGAPKLLIDRYSYRQIGAATYWPIGGEEITCYAQTKSGSWIAGTNVVLESDMTQIWWLPEFVGECVIGDSLQRTTTTGSALVLSARNLLGQPYLLQLPCMGSGARLDVFWRFEAGERKQITLGPENIGDNGHVVFDLDATEGRAL